MSYNYESLSSSENFAKTFMDNAYPGDEVRVKASTRSQNANQSSLRSLSSRTLSEALSGDTMNRSSKLSLSTWTKFFDSDIKSLIVGSAEVGYGINTVSDESTYNLSVVNPNSFNTQEAQRLEGGAAFNQLLSRTILSRNAGQDIVRPYVDALNAAYVRSQNENVLLGGIPHDTGTSTITNIELLGAAPRPETGGIAIEEFMSQEEVGWLKDRTSILRRNLVVQDSEILANGFLFDLPDELTDLLQNSGVHSSGESGEAILPDIIQLSGGKTTYLAPVLIELLIYLGSTESQISVVGHTGAGGTVTGQETGEVISDLEAGDYVNDHVVGRAIDIISVAKSDGTNSTDLYNNGSGVSLEIYRTAFEMVMDELNKIGLTHPYLLPDSIGIHGGLRAELEIQDDAFEVENSAVRQKYPGLKYVDFYASETINSYIHLSFGASRCGVYSGPGVLSMGVIDGKDVEVDLSSGVGEARILVDGVEVSVAGSYNSEDFTIPYIGEKKGATLNLGQIFLLLKNVMTDEAAAIFCAISEREGGFSPSAFNPRCFSDTNLPLPTATFVPAPNRKPQINQGIQVLSSYLTISTSKAFYDKAREAVDYWESTSQGLNSNGILTNGGFSQSDIVTRDNVLSRDFSDKFDSSGLVYWALTKIGVVIDFKSNKVGKLLDSSSIPMFDWSNISDIITIFDKFNTKFIDSDGNPDYNRAWNTPGAIMIRKEGEIPVRDANNNIIPGQFKGGHVVICKGTGKDRSGGLYGTVIHAAGPKIGVVEQGLEDYEDYRYVGLLPGLADSGSEKIVRTGIGGTTSIPVSIPQNLDYSIQDIGARGDWSVGLFQVNLLGNAHGTKDFFFPIPSPGAVVPGWKIGLGKWESYEIPSAAVATVKMIDLYKPYEGVDGGYARGQEDLFDEVDERAWIPLNQAYLLYTTATGNAASGVLAEVDKGGYSKKYIFTPWGDYNGGPYYGFLSNTKFQIAVEVYKANTNKTADDLKNWVRQMMSETLTQEQKNADLASLDGDDQRRRRGLDNLENWLNGCRLVSTWNSSAYQYTDGGVDCSVLPEIDPTTLVAPGGSGSGGGGGGDSGLVGGNEPFNEYDGIDDGAGTLYPNGYGTTLITLQQMRERHEPNMHPEFARRVFAWIESKNGLFGIGGGWRAPNEQPDEEGFAPEGKSFHQSQSFPSGSYYCALDLVVRTSGTHISPSWDQVGLRKGNAECIPWGLHCNIINKNEPWHIQPIEIDGWQGWVDDGRPDLEYGYSRS